MEKDIDILKFESHVETTSIIKVMGVGGGGSNAVNYMFKQGITGVDFVVCNTDLQSLENSPVPYKIQLGANLTEGRGAGANAEIGKKAAMESIDQLREFLSNNTKMLFITAGMGGGTGTGAAPVIAQIAKELDILTVGIVTIPFRFEGRKKILQAEAGIKELTQYVDTIIVIDNDKIRELFGNLSYEEAFNKADNVLTIAAKGIAEIITVTGRINVDFEDVKTVMKNGGVAIMGSAIAEGENKALKAVTLALACPLLNYNQIKGAAKVLVNICTGDDNITLDEMCEINDYIQEQAGNTADIILGIVNDEKLGEQVSVTVVATSFENVPDIGITSFIEPAVKVVHELENKVKNQEIINETPQNNKDEINLVEEFHVKIVPSEEKKENISIAEEKQNSEIPLTISQSENIKNEQNFSTETINVNESVENNIFVLQKETPAPIKNTTNQALPEKQPAKQNFVSNEKQFELNSTTIHDDKNFKEITRQRLKEITKLALNNENDSKNIINYNEDIEKLEKTPAYLRKGIVLNETTPSSETVVSRLSISSDSEGNTQLRDANSFLHDKAD
jgi:cell division protein FtsZ